MGAERTSENGHSQLVTQPLVRRDACDRRPDDEPLSVREMNGLDNRRSWAMSPVRLHERNGARDAILRHMFSEGRIFRLLGDRGAEKARVASSR